MKKRTYRYFIINKILKLAKIQAKYGCIEFPSFGARYPDATCIDGMLWDLDSCDGNGGLTSGGDTPCPVCSTKAYVNDLMEMGMAIDSVHKHIDYIFKQYGVDTKN